MGLGLFKSNSGCSCLGGEAAPATGGKADARKFKILRTGSVGAWTFVEIKYEGVTNYEGRKVLLYEASVDQVSKAKFLDPHFCESTKHLSPVARFEPTTRGWLAATTLAAALHQVTRKVQAR
jgi:hypothetical protein